MKSYWCISSAIKSRIITSVSQYIFVYIFQKIDEDLNWVCIHSFIHSIFWFEREIAERKDDAHISIIVSTEGEVTLFQFNYRKGNESESISPYLYTVDVVVVKSSSPWRLFTQLTLGGLEHYAGPGSSWKMKLVYKFSMFVDLKYTRRTPYFCLLHRCWIHKIRKKKLGNVMQYLHKYVLCVCLIPTDMHCPCFVHIPATLNIHCRYVSCFRTKYT